MKARSPTRIAVLVTSAGPVTGLGVCSGSDDSVTSVGRSEDTIEVVAPTEVWAGAVNVVTGDKKVSIGPIIASSDIDPHSYEPAATDMARVEDADILIADDRHYSAWPTFSPYDAKDEVITSALSQEEGHKHGHNHKGHNNHEGHDDHEGREHGHDHKGHDDYEGHEGHEYHHRDGEVNEYVWHDTDVAEGTVKQLADALTELGAEADAKVADKETKDIEEAKNRLRAARAAQVRPLVDDILKDMKVEDITPRDYRQSTLNRSELSASSIDGILKLIKSGKLDYLIDASQIHDQIPRRLVKTTKTKGVKIVDVFRPSSADQSSFDLHKRILSDMEFV